MSYIDAEIEAMRTIVAALGKLPKEAALRSLAYIVDRECGPAIAVQVYELARQAREAKS